MYKRLKEYTWALHLLFANKLICVHFSFFICVQTATKKLPRKIQITSKLDDLTQVISNELAMANQAESISLNDQALNNQVINIDQSALQQGMLPISLSITDSYGNLADNNLAAQVLQSLEGVQLQLTGNVPGQGIQIAGLDPSVLTQAIQIDANVLQQLQQGGNVNLTINPNVFNVPQSAPTIQTVDPNQVQNMVQPSSTINLTDVVNPNVVIQSLSTLAESQGDIDLSNSDNTAVEPMLLQKHDGTATTVTELSHQQAAQVEQQTLEALGVLQKSGISLKHSQERDVGTTNEDDPFVDEGVSEEVLDQLTEDRLSQGTVLHVHPNTLNGDGQDGAEGASYEVIHVQEGQDIAMQILQQQVQEKIDDDRTHVCPVSTITQRQYITVMLLNNVHSWEGKHR